MTTRTRTLRSAPPVKRIKVTAALQAVANRGGWSGGVLKDDSGNYRTLATLGLVTAGAIAAGSAFIFTR